VDSREGHAGDGGRPRDVDADLLAGVRGRGARDGREAARGVHVAGRADGERDGNRGGCVVAGPVGDDRRVDRELVVAGGERAGGEHRQPTAQGAGLDLRDGNGNVVPAAGNTVCAQVRQRQASKVDQGAVQRLV